MREYIFEFFNSFLSKELAVLLTAAIPIVEIRGAIPLALILGIPIYKAFLLGVIGNIIPIIPLLLLLEPISNYLTEKYAIFKKFFAWLHERTISRSESVKKYGAIGLTIFTAIPLPTTGAWTACVAAILFKIPLKLAFGAISLGVLIAGIIVTIISGGVF